MSETMTFPHAVPPAEIDMPDDRRTSGPRRESDAQLVDTIRNVDAGVSMLWRWANIVATLLCAAFVVGVFYAKTSGIEKAIGNLQEDMKGVQNLDKRVDLNAQALNALTKTVDELRADNKDLRNTIDTMRNMREAYVYDSAKAALRKQPVPTPTPP